MHHLLVNSVAFFFPDCVLAEKPNSKTAEIKEDGKYNTESIAMLVSTYTLWSDNVINAFLTAEFLQIYRRAQDVPPNKYDLPLTEAQEIGWDTQPLVYIAYLRIKDLQL